MKSIEAQAKTVEEAIASGLNELKATISDVTIDIIEEGSKGLFGLFGSKQAKVRITLKEDSLGDDFMAELSAPAKKNQEAVKPAQREKVKEKSSKKEESVKAVQTEKGEAKALREPKPVTPATPHDRETDLGKVQDFLGQLTRLMGVAVEVHVKNDENGNVLANMEGDSLGILIGRRGETLDALQYLTSLYINKGKEGYTRVTLDTENYRAKREEALTRLANRMASRAIKTGRRVNLEPMNPYERRIIHSALQSNNQVDTHSEGDEPNRHLVITLKKGTSKEQA